MKFTGRTFELGYLDRLYQEPNGSLCVVYGRRRVGKTRLLTQWLEQNNYPGFYWLATDSSSTALLRSLSHMVYYQLHSTLPEQAEFSYYDWDALFQELARLIQENGQKYVIILDEFSYAIGAYPDLTHKLQAIWDHQFKEMPVMLVLSGSHIGMMEEGILAHRSPLYGRATGRLKLDQFPYRDVRNSFPGYDIESCVALYSVLGGVPYYLEQIDPTLSIMENVIQRIMGSPALVQDEPRLLLHDHFTQPRLYSALIAQVAAGNHSPKDISRVTDMEPATVSNYLSTLVRLGLLEREVPATERHPERSRRSRYRVTDPYLRFYHRFLLPQLPFLARGAYQVVWKTIERHWKAFIGTHTFEELCREWIYIAAEIGKLPFLPQVVGSHWNKSEQIDVVAINWDEGQVIYGECKWKRDSAFNLGEVEKLLQRSMQIALKTESGHPFETHYIFFSRSGFTKPARDRAREIDAMLVDLDTFDSVMAQAIR